MSVILRTDLPTMIDDTISSENAYNWPEEVVARRFLDEGRFNPIGPIYLLIIPIVFLVLMTVLGNGLVLLAMIITPKLRTPTNMFIANLAIADLILGLIVFPLSGIRFISSPQNSWLLGKVVCHAWLLCDVCCCTASIYSLVAIAAERFIGVTKPLQHQRLVTKKRTISVCVAIWVLSVSISIVQFVWNDAQTHYPPTVNTTSILRHQQELVFYEDYQKLDEIYYCDVNDDRGYAIFSVLFSFYLPAIAIIPLYVLIYRTAVQASCHQNSIHLTKHTGSIAFGEHNHTNLNNNHSNNHSNTNSEMYSTMPRSSRPLTMVKEHEDNDDRQIPTRHRSEVDLQYLKLNERKRKDIRALLLRDFSSGALCRAKSKSMDASLMVAEQSRAMTALKKNRWRGFTKLQKKIFRRARPRPSANGKSPPNNVMLRKHASVGSSASSVVHLNTLSSTTGAGKRSYFTNIQSKAARTLLIVIGVFFVCWTPFFVALPIKSLFPRAIPDLLFDVAILLGYCNSLCNPLIYATHHRQFQNAFRHILNHICFWHNGHCRSSTFGRDGSARTTEGTKLKQGGQLKSPNSAGAMSIAKPTPPNVKRSPMARPLSLIDEMPMPDPHDLEKNPSTTTQPQALTLKPIFVTMSKSPTESWSTKQPAFSTAPTNSSLPRSFTLI